MAEFSKRGVTMTVGVSRNSSSKLISTKVKFCSKTVPAKRVFLRSRNNGILIPSLLSDGGKEEVGTAEGVNEGFDEGFDEGDAEGDTEGDADGDAEGEGDAVGICSLVLVSSRPVLVVSSSS